MLESLQEKILLLNKKCKLIKKNDHVILGFSGGPDSLALLHLLISLQDKINFKLYLAHLNHQLRPAAAKKDEDFVKETAQKYNLPLIVKKVDVADFAKKKGLSIEEAGRIARYDFFLKLAKKNKAHKIALAHSADDQVETFLMRLLRGSGLRGLTAMSAERELKGVKIIRPLLSIWRKEIDAYLKAYELKPRYDISNRNKKFLRNRIRGELIPYLKKYNPQIKKVLNQTTQIFSEILNDLYKKIRRTEEKVILKKNKTRFIFDIERLSLMPLSLQREVLKNGLESLVGEDKNISFVHIEDVMDMLSSGGKNWQLNLPGKLKVLRKNNFLIFTFHLLKPTKIKSYKYKLKIPGTISIPEIRRVLKTSILNSNKISVPPQRYIGRSNLVCLLDYEKISRPLYVRNRRTGDRFQPFGMQGTKKLQDYFVDKKVPQEKRDKIPIIVNSKEILGIPGFTINENFKITPETKKILQLKFV